MHTAVCKPQQILWDLVDMGSWSCDSSEVLDLMHPTDPNHYRSTCLTLKDEDTLPRALFPDHQCSVNLLLLSWGLNPESTELHPQSL